ncbi:MAG: rhodanese-like domain-containing protein [candidate division Zixibacteria bacterium]|nr:rhodanese-like domain-containing protein [candidate division Zixibacteria bacterium]
MKNWFIQLILILLLSTLAALAVNFGRDGGIALIGNWPSRTAAGEQAEIPPSAQEDDPHFITLDDAVAMYQLPSVIFIDARDPEDYAFGYIHRSINIPFDYLDESWEAIIEKLDKESEYVIYCSGTECESSLFLGRYLKELGFSHLYVFYGGWSEWQANNLPVTANEDLDGGEEL